MGELRILEADITSLKVDAIVNAANEQMLGGGGVDGAIHRAAGPELLEACRQVPEVIPGIRCPTGEARMTPGFRLPATYIIHTVGPVWHGGSRGEADLLASCYRKSFALAEELELASIAFPAISCGVFGYPVELAARIAVNESRKALATSAHCSEILLVAFGDSVATAFRAVLET